MSDQQISASTTVEAPAATVFAIIADPRQHSRIDGSGSVGEMIEGPERLAATGDTFRVHMKLFGLPYTMTNRVVEYEPDRLLAWRHVGGHRWRYQLQPTDDGGTQVTETFDYCRYTGLRAKLIEVFGFPERNRRGIEQTLKRLKAAAEADAAAPSAEA